MHCCCKLQETALLHYLASLQLLLPALQEVHHHCCAMAAAAWVLPPLLLPPLPQYLQLCLVLLLVVMLMLHGAAVLVRNLYRHAARCDWAASDDACGCHAAENHMRRQSHSMTWDVWKTDNQPLKAMTAARRI
jgi:hypothetical protein